MAKQTKQPKTTRRQGSALNAASHLRAKSVRGLTLSPENGSVLRYHANGNISLEAVEAQQAARESLFQS